MKKKVLIAIIVLILISCGGMGVYFADYYHAEESAYVAMKSDGRVQVEVKDDMIVFVPEEKTDRGLIFYPGAKVEFISYAPLMRKYAEEGFFAVLVKMPCNFALFGSDKADVVIETYKEIDEWYLAGHSLGGVVASMYAEKHDEDLEGLVLLAAYSTKDLSDTDLEVIRIRGSNDHVLNIDEYEESGKNYPADSADYTIEGGNHAMFGNYGAQDGDGEAVITDEEQQKETVKVTMENIE